jgi:hypothetical protein
LKFGLKFEKMWPYHEREMKKLKYVTKNWMEKIEIFHFSFLKFEMEISFWNLKKIGHNTWWKWKKNEMKKSYISFMPPR